MEAKEFLDFLMDEDEIIRLSCIGQDGKSIGRQLAAIIDFDQNIAVMLGDCGFVEETKIKAGAIVKFATHPEVAEPYIVGTPAYAVPTMIGGTQMP